MIPPSRPIDHTITSYSQNGKSGFGDGDGQFFRSDGAGNGGTSCIDSLAPNDALATTPFPGPRVDGVFFISFESDPLTRCVINTLIRMER
jgi:hypothetical protein